MPYGPEVSWPSGLRAAEFDSGEYRALVESSYERDEYSHVDPRSGGDRRHGGHGQPYGGQPHSDQPYGGQYGEQPYGGPQGYGPRGAAGHQPPSAGSYGYGDPGYGDPGYADPGYGDPRYGDPGYGDPGYADPGYDGPRGYQPPVRPEVRHQIGPGSASLGGPGPVGPAGLAGHGSAGLGGPGPGPVGPASGPQPIYPVTGAQEVYREPDEPSYQQARQSDPRPSDQRPSDQRPSDPRLAGLRYDELRYDDVDLDDQSFPRYDEPLDDEAWYAELRSSGPAQRERPSGGGSAGGGQAGRGSAGGADYLPAGGQQGSGQPAGVRPAGTGGPGRPGVPGFSGGHGVSGGPSGFAGPGAQSARNLAPGSGPGPRMSALPASAAPPGRLPRNPGSGYKAAAAVAPVRPQPAPGIASARDRGYLGAPVAQVGLLTPPAGSSRYEADFAGPETVAWSIAEDVDSGEMQVLEEYWEEDEGDVEYSALLADLGDNRAESDLDTGSQLADTRQRAGRRRGRSGDRRLWLGLGGVVAVAAAAIFLIIKFEFPSDTGPAHTLSMPDSIGSSFVRSNFDSKDVDKLRQEFVKMTNGQATDVQSGTFQSGGPAMGGVPQIVMTLDAHLANDNPASSIAGFMKDYKSAVMVPAGSLGGEAACAEVPGSDADNVAICAWFDNDSFGMLVSPSMNANTLAGQLQTFRSAVEHVARA